MFGVPARAADVPSARAEPATLPVVHGLGGRREARSHPAAVPPRRRGDVRFRPDSRSAGCDARGVLGFEDCYRAIEMKDGRFDGWFITAVTSTGIYCRPSCPATDAACPQRALLRDRRRRPGGRLSCLQALPAGRRAGISGMGREGRSGRAGDAPDLRRGRRSGGRGRPGAPSGLQRAAPAPVPVRGPRRRSAGARAGVQGADRAGAAGAHGSGDRGDRPDGGVLERAAVQHLDARRCSR